MLERIPSSRWVLIRFVAIGVIALAFFVGLPGVLHGDPSIFDRNFMLALRRADDLSTPIGPTWLRQTLQDITALGDTPLITLMTIAAVGYLIAARKPAFALQIALTVAMGATFNTLIKTIVERPRPDIVPHLTHFSSHSFPSGHAFNSTVFFLTLGVLLARAQPRRPMRTYILTFAALFPLTIGFTRVYLGVHWPSDVMAGWCLGAAWVWLSMLVANRFGDQRA